VHAKALGATGSGTGFDVARAMRYLADSGAKIVNLSLGGAASSHEAQAIAARPGTLFVIAAGNSTKNNDIPAEASYPCADPAPNVLCVGASTDVDTVASFSNYGATSVDLMAPGEDVLGLDRGGNYRSWNGTSFSSPITAGVAALLKAARPDATAAELKAAILVSADPVAAMKGKTLTGGRLNAAKALQSLTGAAAPAPAATPPAPTPSPAAAAPTPTPAPAPEPEQAAVDPLPAFPAAPLAPRPEPQPAAPTVRFDPTVRLDARGRKALVRLTFVGGDPDRQAAVRLLGRSGLFGAGSLRSATELRGPSGSR
jgi:subtilisin family serine protease